MARARSLHAALIVLLAAAGLATAAPKEITLPGARADEARLDVRQEAPGRILARWQAGPTQLGLDEDGKAKLEMAGERALAGEGALPRHGGLVRLPEGHRGRLNVSSGTLHRVDGATGAVTATRTLRPGEEEQFVQLGEAGIWRDVVVAPLVVQPARAEGEDYWIAGELSIEVQAVPAEGLVPARTSGAVSRAFWPLYQQTLLNGTDDLGLRLADRRGTYLVVSSSAFEVALSTFLDWKRQQGFNVVHHTFDAAPTLSELRTIVETAWQSSDPPLEYVLLVGDLNSGSPADIPAQLIQNPLYPTENDATDWPLVMLEGGDYFPEVMIGRMPVGSQSNAYKISSRVVAYETNASQVAAGHPYWRSAALVAANFAEGNSYPLTPVSTTQFLEDKLSNDWGITHTVPLYWRQGLEQTTAADIVTALNEGAIFTTYRGWGNAAQWVKPEFDIDDVDNINNQGMLTVLTSFVCNTGDFANPTYQPMFGEKWLIAGTPSEPTGAVAVVAPTDLHTNTRYNNSLIIGFFDGLYDEGMTTISQALLRAKWELYQGFPTEQAAGEPVHFYYHVYHVLGDPSLSLWKRPPRSLDVSAPSTVALGQGHLDVEVTRSYNGAPLRGAYVQAMQGGEQLGGGYTNDAGSALLDLSQAAAGEVALTITCPEFAHQELTVQVQEQASFVGVESWSVPGGGPVAYGAPVDLNVVFENSGTTALSGLTATLSHPDEDLVNIISGEAALGDLAAGATASTPTPYQLELLRPAPDGALLELDLAIGDGSGEWAGKAWLPVGGAVAEIAGTSVAGGSFSPGGSASLSFEVKNAGSVEMVQADVTLQSWDDAVTVTGATTTSSPIAPGATGAVGPFDVSVAGDTYNGRPVTLQLLFSTAGEADTLELVNFTLPLEGAQPSDPLGPDSHGYFAYDNTDSAWPEAPTYTWFDLAGEAGAELTELVDDQLTRVALPFDFTFYGETFAAGDSITISSNGWLSFHEEDYDYANNFFRNWHIPSSMGPRGLVAGFWDDLKPTYPSTENMIELRTWYDADGGKYVVEWTNTVNRFAYDVPANYPAEFAVVLYDPAVHTTPTGDGVIEFHYLDVENVDERDNFATVGIERPDKTAGLEVTFALQYPDAAAVIEDGRAIRFTTTAPDNYAQGGEAAGPLPRELALHPATPNPFNSSVEVRFDLPREGRVRLEAFNVLGRRVATLLDEQMAAGRRTVRWNVPAGQVSSGMLLLRLQAADQVRWGKALYLK